MNAIFLSKYKKSVQSIYPILIYSFEVMIFKLLLIGGVPSGPCAQGYGVIFLNS